MDEHKTHTPGELDDKYALEAIAKVKKGPFGYLVTHTRVVILLIIAIVLLGSIALFSMPRESDPEVKIPVAVVTTFFPGASPADVESLVTDKIENRLEELDNVKLITSSSQSSLSSVVVEFEASADLEDSVRELKDKVAEVRDLPDDAEDPTVVQIRANDYPIIAFSLAGDLSDLQFKQLGELVQDELEGIPGVSKAPLLGTLEKEYSVIANRGELNRLKINFNQIIGSIAASNIDSPLGFVTVDDVDYNLRTVGKFTSVDDVKNVVVSTVDGHTVYLKDIAVVEERLTDAETISRISLQGQPGQKSITLQIYKKTGGNILDIVDAAKQKVTDLQESNLIPDNVSVELSSDFSQFIRDDLNTLGSSGVQSAILIFIVILVALTLREAILAFLAIPLTFLVSFFFLNVYGFTINSLVLFALVLSLGLLVDTFVVILEGIFHNMRSGWGPRRSAMLSIAHYAKPLLSGQLTTIAAFFPMLLVSGILGEYLRIFPLTIATVLIASLIVSIGIVPPLAGFFMRSGKAHIAAEGKYSVLERFVTNRLRKWYKVKILKLLDNKKAKFKFVLATVGLFFVSLGLLIFGVVPVQLFPNVDIDFAYINIKMPPGTDLVRTEQMVVLVEDVLNDVSEIDNYVTTVGQSLSLGFGSSNRASDNRASININFVPKEDRGRKSFEILEDLREKFKYINEGEITVEELSGGPPTGAPIEARITGQDLVQLDALATQVVNTLKDTPGVINVSSNQDITPADFTFTLRKENISRAGLTAGEISGFLRTAIFGVTATQVSVGGDDIDVVVKLDKDKIASVEQLKNLSIFNNRGEEYKLSYLADFSLQPALTSIQHRDFERTFTVQADLEPGFVATRVTPDVEQKLQAAGIPNGYEISFGGEVEEIDQSFTELWNAMIVAVILILIILVFEFDSFLRPLIIMMVLPLMLIGVVVGMLILQLPFSFSVFLGIISLAGIGVNDGIVLMDKTMRNIKEKNMSPRQAVADAGDTRLQPIILTSVTTIIGVIPLAFADEFWLGLSASIIFGMLFAMVLQLFFIPMLFLKFEGKKIIKRLQSQ